MKICIFEKNGPKNRLEAILSRFWTNLGAKKGAKTTSKRTKNQLKTMLDFYRFFEPKRHEKEAKTTPKT